MLVKAWRVNQAPCFHRPPLVILGAFISAHFFACLPRLSRTGHFSHCAWSLHCLGGPGARRVVRGSIDQRDCRLDRRFSRFAPSGATSYPPSLREPIHCLLSLYNDGYLSSISN